MAATDKSLPAVPTSELGRVLEANLLGFPGAGSSITTPIDDHETVRALMWPQSPITYDQMRNETQLDSLLQGLFMPIENYRWSIDPGKATPESAQRMAEDLGLPLSDDEDSENVETRSRFSHGEFLRHALLAPIYGHYFFELVGEVDDAGFARLVKLAPRPPRTIQAISVAKDGGLEWIKQWGLQPPEIPIDRLVVFCWRKEAANWFGRSILRSCYGPWVAKDRLVRDDLTKHRRNATGMPVLEMSADPTPEQKAAGMALVESYRSADKGGGLLPAGWKLGLQGVQGGTSTPLDSIIYHDGQMARRFAQMVMELGSTKTGNRALGETFNELLNIAQLSIARWYQDVVQQHVIEKFTAWNDGPGAPAPKLCFDPKPDPKLTEIETAVSSGLVAVDDNVEDIVRASLRLPPIDKSLIRMPSTVVAGVTDPATGLPAARFPARRAKPNAAGGGGSS